MISEEFRNCYEYFRNMWAPKSLPEGTKLRAVLGWLSLAYNSRMVKWLWVVN